MERKREEEKQLKEKELKRQLQEKESKQEVADEERERKVVEQNRKVEEDKKLKDKERERKLAEQNRKVEEDKQREEKDLKRQLEERERRVEEVQKLQATLDKNKQDQDLQRQQGIEELNKQKADAAVAEATMQDELNKYRNAIVKKVRENWNFEPRGSLRVIYQLRLSEAGDVVVIQLVKTSGDAAYDESVKKAIQIASPLPVPKDQSFFQKTFGTGVSIIFIF